MEHTGVYTTPLISALGQQELAFVVENPLQIKRSMGIVRIKSDKADSLSLARYAQLHHKQLRLYQFQGKQLLKLRALIQYRQKLIKARVQFATTYKELKEFTDADIHASIIEAWQELQQQLQQHIKKAEDELKQLIKKDQALNKNFKLLISIKGIGPVTAYNTLAYTRNFTAFDNPKAFACYAGTAPFEHSSGSSIKRRNAVSQIANKRLKALLHEAAWAAATWDPQIKKYYERLLEKGKPKLLIINNIKNKLIHRMFAVIKRQTPYVTFAH